jgi:uncharacterized protein YqgV (UPF0045/DUF77 family)
MSNRIQDHKSILGNLIKWYLIDSSKSSKTSWRMSWERIMSRVKRVEEVPRITMLNQVSMKNFRIITKKGSPCRISSKTHKVYRDLDKTKIVINRIIILKNRNIKSQVIWVKITDQFCTPTRNHMTNVMMILALNSHQTKVAIQALTSQWT